MKHKKIVKYALKDKIPDSAIFLYAEKEFKGYAGYISNPRPIYEMVFYYEIK